MKRIDLIKQLEGLGCDLVRHGGKHDWYRQPANGVSQAVCPVIGKSRNVWPAESFGC
jgi:predicted RNA binding protein YcfA (HicA-like mRNA interferase family)